MNKPIRILHVIHGMDCGGAENLIMNLYRNVNRDRIQFDFLVHTDKKCFFDEEISSLGGYIYHVPYYFILNTIQYKRALDCFFSDHPEIKIVHGHLGSCAHVYLKVAKKYGCFAIAHSHSTKPNFSIKNMIYRGFTYITRHTADYFIGCSFDSGIYRFGEKIVYNTEKFCVLNNAIDTDNYAFDTQIRQDIRKELNINEDFVVGHVGRFDVAKNQSFVIEVFDQFHGLYPNSRLILVGTGKMLDEIKEKVREKDLLNFVIFTGIRDDVPKIMMAMDTFIFPSKYEGFGIVALEAQATGLPTIVSENIPVECHVTDIIQALSLDDPISYWVNMIIKMGKRERKSMHKKVKEAGFDIKENAKWLENFYIRIQKGDI